MLQHTLVGRFVIARLLVGVFGLLLMGYVLTILPKARGYRKALIIRSALRRKALEH